MFLANATIDTSSFRNFSTQPLARSGKSHSPTTEMAARKASPRSNSRGKAMAPRRTSNITVVSLMEVSIGRSFCLILFITSLLVSVDTIRERIRCTISVRHWDDLMGDCVLRARSDQPPLLYDIDDGRNVFRRESGETPRSRYDNHLRTERGQRASRNNMDFVYRFSFTSSPFKPQRWTDE